jgi:hypothetical protein
MTNVSVHIAGEGANTVLAGVMRGCGRQQLGAAVSLVTYWALGLPLAYALAFKFKMGAVGLWVGLTGTAGVQALLNCIIICRCETVRISFQPSMRTSSHNLEGSVLSEDSFRITYYARNSINLRRQGLTQQAAGWDVVLHPQGIVPQQRGAV